MPDDWKIRAARMHERFCRQYGNVTIRPGSVEDIRFLTLALCGEAGELANLIKKDWRGDAGDRSAEIAGELADVRIYLEHLARGLGVDLDDAAATKLDEVETRIAAREIGSGGRPAPPATGDAGGPIPRPSRGPASSGEKS